MSQYNPNIHHRRSIRLKGYDYSQAGLYFITLCCYDRKCLFGEVVATDGAPTKMVLNNYGQIAYDEWIKTTEVRDNVELGEFIIMPNHMHGIVKLSGRGEVDAPISKIAEFKSPQQTIGAIVRGYKSAVTKQLNLLNIGCVVWQRDYYEIIIKDELAYQNISNYIINNPAKWAVDKSYIL